MPSSSEAVLDAPSRPRPRPRPRDTPAQSLKRRYGQDAEQEYSAREPFKIFPYAPNIATATSDASSLLISPAELIPRRQLPLAYISPTANTLLPNSLFRSSASLAITGTHNDSTAREAMSMIVSVHGHAGLCVMEHVCDDVYSIIKLASWVKIEHVRSLKSSCSRIPSSGPRVFPFSTDSVAEPWWTHAALPLPHVAKRRRLESYSSCQMGAQESAVARVEAAEKVDSPGMQEAAAQEIPTEQSAESPDDALISFVTQYLECLYISKVPHAYFAKTPLARVRTVFRKAQRTDELVQALRHMILTASCLDSKYRGALPGKIKAMSLVDNPEDDAVKKSRTTKKRKLRKPKPNKEGLYSVEETYLTQWWSSEQDNQISDALSSLQKSVQSLRFRETLLQIILILEVMSLEAIAAPDALQKLATEQPGKDTKEHSRGKSRKRKEDLELLLDLHIDRLCIYQSLQDISVKETETIHVSIESEVHGRNPEEDVGQSRDQRDDLKDFCTAVVIPFYGTKLPKTVKLLGRKAGVQVGSSSAQKPSRERPAPGTEIKRRRPEQARGSVARVKAQHADGAARPQIPSLSRSATDSLLHSLERPKSATPSAGPMFGEPRRSLSRANSTTQSARGRTREVDMTAIQKFNQSRQKKVTNVEQELQDAIATLKKPNRGLAVKEYVDAADSRKAAQRPAARRAQTTAAASARVQIGATPRRPTRTFSQIQSTPSRRGREQTQPDVTTDPLADLQQSTVPSSVLRPRAVSSMQPLRRDSRAISIVRSDDGHDSDSDLDGFLPQLVAKPLSSTDVGNTIFSSVRKNVSSSGGISNYRYDAGASVAMTPTKPRAKGPLLSPDLDGRGSLGSFKENGYHGRSRGSADADTRTGDTVMATPVKEHRVSSFRLDSGVGVASMGELAGGAARAVAAAAANSTPADDDRSGGKSIYASLGWDTDDF